MKAKYLHLAALALCLGAASCSEDALSDKSVFDGVQLESDDRPEVQEFDNWLQENYTKPYNIDFKYRYNDNESDLSYNVIPALFEPSRGLAILVKHVWVDSYEEAVGAEFIKTYAPRVIQLTGSYKWNSNGSQVMGTAEGGIKVMLYGVNEFDIDNARINSDNPYEPKSEKPMDLNYWFFHTMHHEFCHILTQKKNYSTEFQTISAGTYHSTDWINVKDEDAANEGFVTGYASGEYNEDFAEVYANYVTLSDAGWNAILAKAVKKDAKGNVIKDGTATINKKLSMVKEYFMNSWGIDLDQLRQIVLRRSAEAPTLDLRKLN